MTEYDHNVKPDNDNLDSQSFTCTFTPSDGADDYLIAIGVSGVLEILQYISDHETVDVSSGSV